MDLGYSPYDSTQTPLLQILQTAADKGFSAVQVFLVNPRQPMPDASYAMRDREDVVRLIDKTGLKVFVHAPVTGNMVSATTRIQTMTAISIQKHLKLADKLKFEAVVAHVGSCKDKDWVENLRNCLFTIYEGKYAQADYPRPRLLLENSSGAGNQVATLEGMERIRDEVIPQTGYPVGFCFDTAHGWASGVDITDPDIADAIVLQFDIGVVHINNPDIGVTLGCTKDRHRAGFNNGEWSRETYVATLKAFDGIPLIMETFLEDDKEEVAAILG